MVVDVSDQVQLGRSGQETMVNIIENWVSLKPALEAKVAQADGVALSEDLKIDREETRRLREAIRDRRRTRRCVR